MQNQTSMIPGPAGERSVSLRNIYACPPTLTCMGDKHFTLFELHFDGDPQFGPAEMSIPGEAQEGTGDESIDVEGVEDFEDLDVGSGSAGGLVIGLLFLIVLAVVVKKVLGGDEESEAIDVE